MKPLDEYILDLKGEQRDIIEHLDYLLREVYQLNGSIKWRIPFYECEQPVCYLNPIKKDGVECVFFDRYGLTKDQGLLQANGRKIVRGVRLFRANELPVSVLESTIEEAIFLIKQSIK